MGRLQFVLLMPSWRGWGFGKFMGQAGRMFDLRLGRVAIRWWTYSGKRPLFFDQRKMLV